MGQTNNRKAWELMYRRTLELEGEYAEAADIANVNDCIQLSRLLRHYKEQLTEEGQPE